MTSVGGVKRALNHLEQSAAKRPRYEPVLSEELIVEILGYGVGHPPTRRAWMGTAHRFRNVAANLFRGSLKSLKISHPSEVLAFANEFGSHLHFMDLRRITDWKQKEFKKLLSYLPHIRELKCQSLTAPHLVNLAKANLTGLKVLKLVNEQVIHFAGLPTSQAATSLTSLSLKSKECQGIAALATSPFMTNLTRLKVRTRHLEDADVQAIATSRRCANLTSLDLVGFGVYQTVHLRTESVQAIAKLTGLKELRLSLFRDVSLRLLKPLQNLTCLSLPDSHITSEDIAALVFSTSLTSLNITGSSIGDRGAFAIANAPALCRLTELFLRNSGIGIEGVRALTTSPYLTHLETVDLLNSPIEGSLIFSSRLQNIRVLHLPGCSLKDQSVEAIVSQHFLQELDLRRNQLGNESAALLAKSSLDYLQILDLCSNRIEQEGAKALINSKLIRQLRRLVLIGNPIVDTKILEPFKEIVVL